MAGRRHESGFTLAETAISLALGSILDTGETLSLETVCENVQSVKFHLTGTSAQMFLTLQDGGSSRVVNTCATRRSP